MTLPLAFVKLIITDEIIENINDQLNKIVNSCDLNQMEIGIPYDKVEVPEFEKSQIQHTKEIWEDIAKLSINLFVDYQHHCQFLFKSRYSKTEYELRLVNLGFVFKNGLWKSVRKPELLEVQINMVMYFLYSIISDKMALKADNEVNEENERRRLELNKNAENIDTFVEIVAHDNDYRETVKCQYCESENSKANEICHICAGEIRDVAVTDTDNTLNDNGDVATRECLLDYRDFRIQKREKLGDNVDGNMGDNEGVLGQCIGEKDMYRKECCGLTVEVSGDNDLQSTHENTRRDLIERRTYGNEINGRYVKVNEGKDLEDISKRQEVVHRNGDMSAMFYSLCFTDYGNIQSPGNDYIEYNIYKNDGDKARIGGQCMGNNGRDVEECGGLTLEVKRDNDLESAIEDSRRDLIGTPQSYMKHESKDLCEINRADLTQGLQQMNEVEDLSGGREIMNQDIKSDNSGIYSLVGDDTSARGIIVGQWMCGKCHMRQPYNNIACVVCGSSRLNVGIWQCNKCTLVIKCDRERCIICGTWSNDLPVKYCMDCKTSRVVGTELSCRQCARNRNIEWKCRYDTCGRMNKESEEYCSKCGLWRRNPFGRGNECRRKTKDGIERVWVCHDCDRVNSITALWCSKWFCDETRYGPMTCDNCHKYNNGTSYHCYNCHL